MANLSERHEQLATESTWDFSDLRALFINCTLKRSPEVSNTRGLTDLAVAIMERNGVSVEVIRAVDHQIATGVYPDMTEHGWDQDDWPEIFEKVIPALSVKIRDTVTRASRFRLGRSYHTLKFMLMVLLAAAKLFVLVEKSNS